MLIIWYHPARLPVGTVSMVVDMSMMTRPSPRLDLQYADMNIRQLVAEEGVLKKRPRPSVINHLQLLKVW